jgi:hypothetical protein
MADYDQDAADSCEKLLTTRDGIKAIDLYLSSVGRLVCFGKTIYYDDLYTNLLI